MAALRYPSGQQAVALAWLAALAAVALLAPYLPLPYGPALPDLAHVAEPPFRAGSAHWLGTDAQGQDVLANLVFGTRTVVLLTLPAAVLATALGAVAGGAAGFWGKVRLPGPAWALVVGLAWWGLRLPGAGLGLGVAGAAAVALAWAARAGRLARLPTWPLPLDGLVLGTAALLGAVPRLVLVAAVASTGVTPIGLLALLVVSSWPDAARLVRAQMLRVRALPFVEAAVAAGVPPARVWWRHAMPHAMQPLRAAFPLSLAGLVGLETTLSFLGIGLPPEVPSWGRMLNSVRLELDAWWLAAFPALALLGTLLALQVLARSVSSTSVAALKRQPIRN